MWHVLSCITHLIASNSFHNKLKSNPKYFGHKVNRRCDDLLETLLKLEEDMFHERMQREIMMPLSIASQKLDGKLIDIVCPLSFKLRRDIIYKALNICILQCAIGCKRHARAKDIKQEYVKVHLRDKQ